MAPDRRESCGRNCEIEKAIAVRWLRALDTAEFLPQCFVGLRILRVARHISDASQQSFDHSVIDRTCCELTQAFRQVISESITRQLWPTDANKRKPFGQETTLSEIVERRNEQPMGQVTCCSKDHKAARIGRAHRCRGGLRRHGRPALGSTCSPKPLRIAERTFSANVCSRRERKRA